MREASLIFHRKSDMRGNAEQITVEWDGPKDGRIIIDGYFIEHIDVKVGDIVSVGPYKLRCFDFEPLTNFYHFIEPLLMFWD